MLIFESETYTMLTVFSDTEAGIAGKIALTEGRETQMQMAIGQRPVTFSLKTNTTYTLQTEETDVHFAYLHGGENLLEKGVRFLQSSNHKYDLHTVPPQGGVFGPAAMFRYNGMYHMFYIWNPFGENLKTLYWGHAAGKRKTALRPMPIVAMPPEELQLSRYRYGGAIGGTVEACGDTVKLLYTQCILDKEMHPISFGQMESLSRDILYFSEQEPTLNTLRGCCPIGQCRHSR